MFKIDILLKESMTFLISLSKRCTDILGYRKESSSNSRIMQFSFNITKKNFGIEYDMVQCAIERSIVNLKERISVV